MEKTDIIGTAWDIVRKNKVLWLFGFLSGIASESNLERVFEFLPRETQLSFVSTLENLLAGNRYLIAFAIIGAFVLLLAIVNIFGEVALISQTIPARNHQSVTVHSGIQSGIRFTWRVFWIDAIVSIPLLVIGLISILTSLRSLSGLPVDTSMDFLSRIEGFEGWFCAGTCILILVYILITWVFAMAQCTCVLEDTTVGEALAKGWQLTIKNFGRILTFVLGLAVTLFLAGIVILIAYFIIGLPALAITFALESSGVIGTIVVVLDIVVLIIIGMIIGAITNAFRTVGWTLLYDELAQKMARVPQVTPSWLEE